MRSKWLLWSMLGLLLLWSLSAPVQAQFIQIRISVKHLLDTNGLPPVGGWLDSNHWRVAVDLANAGNARMGRGFRYQYPTFDGAVSGFSQYFDLEAGEDVPFEYDLRMNPVQSHWRDDAINIYVVRANLGCSGWASNPTHPISDQPPYSSLNGRISAFCVGTGPTNVMAHEFGHHMGLIHTWNDDEVADTPTDTPPDWCGAVTDVLARCECKFSNTVARAIAQGWSAETLWMMTNNLMSYHCDNEHDWELSEGQLDRWADTARLYLASEMTGITHFVDRNYPGAIQTGTSVFPHKTVASGVAAANPAGGDIVLVRPGNYNEHLTISKRVALRAPRTGWVTIGRP